MYFALLMDLFDYTRKSQRLLISILETFLMIKDFEFSNTITSYLTFWQCLGLLNNGRICHIWRAKLRGQFFKRTQQSKRKESCIMCYLDFCIQLFFSPRGNVKSLSEQNFKKIYIKYIKMKPAVALFKKKSKKLCLLLKAKNQNLINSCTLFA